MRNVGQINGYSGMDMNYALTCFLSAHQRRWCINKHRRDLVQCGETK